MNRLQQVLWTVATAAVLSAIAILFGAEHVTDKFRHDVLWSIVVVASLLIGRLGPIWMGRLRSK